jgi:hypothetical protein
VKKQMETMLQQSGLSMSPEMMGMMKTMDFSQDKVGAGGQEASRQGALKAPLQLQLCGGWLGCTACAAGFKGLSQAVF